MFIAFTTGNGIILEYRGKDNFQIEFVGRNGDVFTFRLRHPLAGYAAGQTVHVSASNVISLAEVKTEPATFLARAGEFLGGLFSAGTAHAADFSPVPKMTDQNGLFSVTITGLTAGSTVTVQAGSGGAAAGASRVFTFEELGGGGGSDLLTLSVTHGPAFVSGPNFYSTATITATAKDENGNTVPINDGDVTWTVKSSSISSAPWWGNRDAGAMNGLRWGATAISLTAADTQRTDMSGGTAAGGGGAAPTGATAQLTDIVGSRTVVVEASMNIGENTVTQTIPVNFGDGPLSVFSKPSGPGTAWLNAGAACGVAGNPSQVGYQTLTRLPTETQLQNVAGGSGKQGAAHAAGWPDNGGSTSGTFWYWTGEITVANTNAKIVRLDTGAYGGEPIVNAVAVTVCLGS